MDCRTWSRVVEDAGVGSAPWRFMVLSVWSVRGVLLQGLQTGTALPCVVMGPGSAELHLHPYQVELYLHSYQPKG